MTGPPLTFGSLFTGIGGLDLGLERAGMRCAWQVEIDAQCRGVLTRHWPDVEKYTDVRSVGSADLIPVDVICGGFPCQDLSVAGRRAGLAGERSGLWWEFHRIVADLTPTWVLIENVPGLLSATCPCPGDGACGGTCTGPHPVPDGACPGGCFPAHGGAMGTVLGSLAELGYGWAFRVLDAQHFGVPQRRRRVFVVGRLGDAGAASAAVLFEPDSCQGDSPPGRAAGEAPAGDAADGAGVPRLAPALGSLTGGQRQDLDGMASIPELSHRVSHGMSTPVNDPDRITLVSPTLTAGAGTNRVAPGHGRDDLMVAFNLSPERGQGADLVAVETDLAAGISAAGMAGQSHRGSRVVGAATWDPLNVTGPENRSLVEDGRPSSTLHAQPLGVLGAAAGDVRRLTPTECERLQGFPDGWTGAQKDSPRYRQLGNAVCVPVAAWVARRIAAAAADHAMPASVATTAVAGPVAPPVTAKWAKGTGGPAGDEVQNLVVPPSV